MSVNIKQADGLKRLSQTIEFYKSSSSISVPQLFTGSYNDLTDKPIVDGNATIESIETTQSSFYVQDERGNTIALIDNQGVHSIDFYANGESVKQHMSSSTSQLNDLSGDLTLHKNNQDIHITSEEREKWNDPLSEEGDTLYINDALGNTIAIFDANGLTTTNVTIKFNGESLEISSKLVEIDNRLTSIQNKNNDQDGRLDGLETATEKLDFIDASESDDTFSIVDVHGNPVAQFDASGLTTTEVTVAGAEGSPIQVGAKIEGIEGRVSTAEGEIDTLQGQLQTLENNFSSHTDDATIHITASERSTWNTVTSKANQSDLNTTNQNLATEITNRQNADQVLQGNIDTEAQTRANEDAAINERTAEIEASENGVLSITDPSGNPVAQFDENGLLVTAIQTVGSVTVGGNITTAGNFDSKELSADKVISRGDIEAQGDVKGATITATGNVSAADVKTSSITSLNSTIDTIQNNASALEGRVLTAEGEIDTLQGQVSTLIASDGGKSVRKIANEELAAALIPSDAQESLNTLQEIADWIQDHPEDAAAMNSKIEANTTAINNHINDAEPRIESLEEKTANIEDSAEADAFTVYDKNDQPGFQVDANGTTVHTLNANTVTSENINGTYVSVSEISTDLLAVGDINSVEQAINNLDQSITNLGNDLRPNSHTHNNKSLLDTYDQTNANIKDAVDKKHEHSNKTVLDETTASFTTEYETKLGNLPTGDELTASFNSKQDTLTPGDYINITNNVIGVKDLPYSELKDIPTDIVHDANYIHTDNNFTAAYKTQLDGMSTTYTTKDELNTHKNDAEATYRKINDSYTKGEVDAKIPTVNNATLTIQKNGTNVTTFTANSSTDATANITVPTTVAELTDASNYALATRLNDYRTINDSYSKTEVDAKIPTDFYSKTEADNKFALAPEEGSYALYKEGAWQEEPAIAVIAAGGVGSNNNDTRISDLVLKNDIVNNLTSDLTNVPLSAAQGKVLKTAIDNIGDIAAGAGNGDMLKSIFATQDAANGKVDHAIYSDTANIADNASKLGGKEASEYALTSSLNDYRKISDSYTKTEVDAKIPTVNNATLTIQKNGTNVVTFTANSATNATANITVPTAVAELTDASDYALASSLNDYQPQTLSTPLNNDITTVEDAISAIYSTANQTSSGLGGITSGSISVPKAIADKNGDQIDTTYVKQSQLSDYALVSSLNDYALVSSLNDYRKIEDSYTKTEVDNLIKNLPSDDTNTTYTFTNSGSSLTITPSEGEVTTLDLSTDLSNYYTKDQVYNKTEVNNELQGYATEGYVDGEVTTQLSAALTSYYTKSQVYSKDEVNSLIAGLEGGDIEIPTANSFVNIIAGGNTIAAESSTDTLKFVGGSNVNIAGNAENKTITIETYVDGGVPLEDTTEYYFILGHPRYQEYTDLYYSRDITANKYGELHANAFITEGYGLTINGIDPSIDNNEHVFGYNITYAQDDITSEGAWVANSSLNVTNEIYENNQRVASRTWVSSQLNNYILLQDMYFVSYHHNVSSPISYSFGGEEKGQATSMQLVYALGSDDNSGFFYMPSERIDEDQHPDPSYQIANGYTIASALSQYVSKTSIGYHTDSNQNIEFSIGSNTASPNKSLIYRQNADGEGSFYYEPNEEISQTLNEDAEIATLGDISTKMTAVLNGYLALSGGTVTGPLGFGPASYIRDSDNDTFVIETELPYGIMIDAKDSEVSVTGSQISLEAESDISISSGTISTSSDAANIYAAEINLESSNSVSVYAQGEAHIQSEGDMYITTDSLVSLESGGEINIHTTNGDNIYINNTTNTISLTNDGVYVDDSGVKTTYQDEQGKVVAQIDENGLTVTKINVASDTDNFVKTFRFGDDLQELDNNKKVVRRISTGVPNQNDWGALYEYFRQDVFQMTESIGPDSCVGYFVKAYENAVLPTNLGHYLCAAIDIKNLDSFKVEMLGSYGSAAECTMIISVFTRTAETYKLQICSKHNWTGGGYSSSGWYKEGTTSSKVLDLSNIITNVGSDITVDLSNNTSLVEKIKNTDTITIGQDQKVWCRIASTAYDASLICFVGSYFGDGFTEHRCVIRLTPDNSLEYKNI